MHASTQPRRSAPIISIEDALNYIPRKYVVYDPKTKAYGFIYGPHHNYPRYWVEAARCRTPNQMCEWLLHLSQKVWFTADHMGQFLEITEKKAWKRATKGGC